MSALIEEPTVVVVMELITNQIGGQRRSLVLNPTIKLSQFMSIIPRFQTQNQKKGTRREVFMDMTLPQEDEPAPTQVTAPAFSIPHVRKATVNLVR